MRRDKDQRLAYIEYKPELQRDFVQKFNSKKKVAKKRGDKSKKPAIVNAKPVGSNQENPKLKYQTIQKEKVKKLTERIEDNGIITNIEILQL